MIINPIKKKNYVMVKCRPIPENTEFENMKELVLDSFPEDVDKPQLNKMEFGYVEPGHGLKGKKVWILDKEGIERMIEGHSGKKSKDITLWCYSSVQGSEASKSRSRSKSPVTKPPKQPRSSRYDAQIAKTSRVDEIYKKLSDIHDNKFTPEQKSAWAHMIEMGKHISYDVPPKKRFFQQAKDKPSENEGPRKLSSTPSTSATALPAAVSPGCRVGIRSECIDQLQKWHALYEVGAVTKEQYDELQTSILSDIKNL